MSWKVGANSNCIIFDEGWQYPAITEKHASMQMMKLDSILPYQFVGFPWATLIDFKNRAKEDDVSIYLEKLKSCPMPFSERRITVSQHISTLKRIEFFKEIGVTDIFCAHATDDKYLVDGIRIHAFPLYPVQTPTLDPIIEKKSLSRPRKFLYSFVGTYPEKGYISDIRKKIFDKFNDPDGRIIRRQEWHYEQIVYKKQIGGVDLDEETKNEKASQEQEYKDVLMQSTFSLCPSGSGPNSIRLWESLGALSIPVIFSNNLRLPGDQDLWKRASIFLREDEDNPQNIISELKKIANDPLKLQEMRSACMDLWLRYGKDCFIYDILKMEKVN
jgi:hypothetical protein